MIGGYSEDREQLQISDSDDIYSFIEELNKKLYDILIKKDIESDYLWVTCADTIYNRNILLEEVLKAL